MKVVSLENLSKYNELLNQKTVRSVNNIQPDSNGNVHLGTEKSTFNKVEYDTGYFSITASKTYNFDLTGSDLENVSKENVNVRLVAKVITAHNGFEVGDIAQLTSTLDRDYNQVVDVCSYIRGNTLYIYSGKNDNFSVSSGTSWMTKSNVQIKAVLTAFVPGDGSILLIAEDQTNTSKLIGLPDGTLTWKDKNLVRSVNGVNADERGNVEITTSGTDLSGVVKSVNGIQPDESGSVTLEIPSTNGLVKSVNNIQPDENGNISLNVFTTPGNIIKWETDYFDIAPSGLYSFDLSNTPFANTPREAINIQMVGKVKTAQSGFKVDDYVYPQFANYIGNDGGIETGSTSYISGNVLSIRFGNYNGFVASTPSGPASWIKMTNVKVKLILTAWIKEV